MNAHEIKKFEQHQLELLRAELQEKPHLKESVERLAEHVRDNMTIEEPSVTITYRDIPIITGESQYYSKKLYEALKDHPNINYKIDENAKSGKKPLRFSYVSEDLKLQSIDNKRFTSLTNEQIDFIKENIATTGYRFLKDTLTIVNFLKSEENQDGSIKKITPWELSDVLLERQEKVELLLKSLTDSMILIDKGDAYHLVLNLNELEEERNRQIIESQNREKDTSEPTNSSIEGSQTPEEQNDGTMSPPPSITGAQSSESFEDRVAKILESQVLKRPEQEEKRISLPDNSELETNFNMFLSSLSELQNDFKAYIKSEVVDNIQNDQTKQEQLDKSLEVIDALILENGDLKDENKLLKSENKKITASLDRAVSYKKEFTREAQQELQNFLGQVISELVAFSSTPKWKIDQNTISKLQANIVSGVTSTVENIIGYKRE